MFGLRIISKFGCLLKSRRGNFAIIAALALPVMIMAVGFAFDATNALNMKVRLQNAADSASLAASNLMSNDSSVTKAQAEEYALQFVKGQLSQDFSRFDNMSVDPKVSVDQDVIGGKTINKVNINLAGTFSLTPAAQFLGSDKLTVRVNAQSATSAIRQAAISMALALDVSYSMNDLMNGERKIDVLKDAVRGMLDVFKKADPDSKYIRIGGAPFGGTVPSFRAPSWDLDGFGAYVNNFYLISATNTSLGTGWALQAVLNPKEDQEHHAKNGQKDKKFMVLMTDGDNDPLHGTGVTKYQADRKTLADCAAAKSNQVEVYTIALNAPWRAQTLLRACASSPSNYYKVESKNELLDTFKKIAGSSSQTKPRLSQ